MAGFELDHGIEQIGRIIEAFGVAVMVLGIGWALGGHVRRRLRDDEALDDYHHLRQGVGKAILLGLEILIAGDIIRTVAIDPTFTSVGVLAAIVVIRTFLSTTLEMEVEGRWPWQRARAHDG